jgi:hypothetical protein
MARIRKVAHELMNAVYSFAAVMLLVCMWSNIGPTDIPSMGGVSYEVASVRAKPEAPAEYDGQYRMPNARWCFQDNGWERWNDTLPNVAWRLRHYGIVDAVVWNDCSSQPANQQIVLATANSPGEDYCARTERGYYVGGVATGRTVIRFNMAPELFDRCHATWSQRAHVISHEVAHVAGIVHSEAWSVARAPAYWSILWFTEEYDVPKLQGFYS